MTFDGVQELGEQAGRLFVDANSDADLLVEVARWERVPDQLAPGMADTQAILINDFAWGFAKVLRAELSRRDLEEPAPAGAGRA
jgi:hypothetical protein